MKIDTDDWIPLADIGLYTTAIAGRTAYRLAADLGLVHQFFGVKCIRRADVATLEAKRRLRGNQRWIADGEAAAEDAEIANERKRRRLAEQGPTKAEKARNRRLRRGEWAKRKTPSVET
jgi:hypothetical protein